MRTPVGDPSPQAVALARLALAILRERARQDERARHEDRLRREREEAWERLREAEVYACRLCGHTGCDASCEPPYDAESRWRTIEREYWQVTRGLALGAALALTLAAPSSAQERTYPVIGTPAYSAGCVISPAYADGSAVARCAEDGAVYVYDPDGQPLPGVPEAPARAPGWYPASSRAAVAH